MQPLKVPWQLSILNSFLYHGVVDWPLNRTMKYSYPSGMQTLVFCCFFKVNTRSTALNTTEFYFKIYTSVWPCSQLEIMCALVDAVNELLKQRCVLCYKEINGFFSNY